MIILNDDSTVLSRMKTRCVSVRSRGCIQDERHDK